MTMDRPTPRCRGLASAVLLAALLSGPAVLAPARAEAQDPRPGRTRAAADSAARRVVLISPRVGPPGTEVTIRPLYLPGVTPVVISIGGTRSGFEELAQTITDVDGNLVGTTTFRVPDWAERDRNYAFMVMDIYFRPLALSEVFFVTGPDGTVLREGWITDEGMACTSFRGDGGELYTLSGDTGAAKVGDRVVVEATVAESSDCPRGTPLRVVRIRRTGDTAGDAALAAAPCETVGGDRCPRPEPVPPGSR